MYQIIKTRRKQRGFTLLELLIVVLIIGILAAVAVPQYKKAVLKSRFSALMPMGKALADANEIYYLANGIYSENPRNLDVSGKVEYEDGTRVLLYHNDETLSFVSVSNDKLPNVRYVVYQKHSANFPDTTMCEAEKDDEQAIRLCRYGLNGQPIEVGSSRGERNWKSYLLTGTTGMNDSFGLAADGCSYETPKKITASQSGAIGTPTCVNGQWKYEWSNKKVFTSPGGYTGWYTELCTGETEYACAGSEWRVQGAWCNGQEEYSCAYSDYISHQTHCDGYTANACTGSTFSGPGTVCEGHFANACSNSIFSGNQSVCKGFTTGACSGSIMKPGSYCWDWYGNGGCNGVLYEVSETGRACCSGNCPAGVPKCGGHGWQNGYCEADTLTSGVCPNGSPTGSAVTTSAGWNGGYCSPTIHGTNCPAGSPSSTEGQCWDGNGNQTSCAN